jgi:hypothetical protein
MASALTQHLMEIKPEIVFGGKERPALKSAITDIRKEIFWKTWDPRRLTAQ